MFDLVRKIRLLCKEQGKTLFSLEQECGFGNGTINKWDKNSPSVSKVLAVANALGVTLSDVLEDEVTQIFSPERLKEAMGEMSYEEFSQKVHVSPEVLSFYLSGERTPAILTAYHMAICLGINPEWFYGYDVPKYLKPAPENGDGFNEKQLMIYERLSKLKPENLKYAINQLDLLLDIQEQLDKS